MSEHKPALGVMPKRLWQEHRARDLAAAIFRHAEVNQWDDSLRGYIRELDSLRRELSEGFEEES